MTTKIEDLWAALRRHPAGAQRRVDAAHPLELYADFQQPDRLGILLLCPLQPAEGPSLKAIRIDRGRRNDGQWSLHIVLDEPALLPVFAELCNDIIAFTRTGVAPSHASGAVLSRIDRWRSLLQAQPVRLSRPAQRGLIGELLFLESELLPTLPPEQAVRSWTGPLGADQDFQLPSGLKVEVKTLEGDADRVRINGLGQLDAGGDDLELAVARLEETGRDAHDAATAWRLVARLRASLNEAPAALTEFDALLRFAGWSEDEDCNPVVVRLMQIDRHQVDANFPRLTRASVPSAVIDANYIIVLPQPEPVQ